MSPDQAQLDDGYVEHIEACLPAALPLDGALPRMWDAILPIPDGPTSSQGTHS